MSAKTGIVARHEKVAFMQVSGTSGTYTRMRKFQSFSTSKNAKEFTRSYVDEAFEESDVLGYSPSISYSFDQHIGNAVHDDIVKITDGELIGEDAVRSIIVVDMTQDGSASGAKKAKERKFAIIPATEGDGTDSYTYSGTMKCKSISVEGEAVSTDNWETCTFTASK